jgi:pimeloyl-ACP methyl ester carboxylesterase
MPFANSDGTPLWWQEAGDGEPLLLVMGLGYHSGLWFRVIAGLARQHRVITFDNRGAGRTGPVPGPYSVEMLAADAAAVLDAAGAQTAHVLGISLGGMITQELALTQPDRLLSLTLVCTHAGAATAVLPPVEVLQLLADRGSLPPEQAMRRTRPISYSASTPDEVFDEDVRLRLASLMDDQSYLAQLQAAGSWRGSHDRLGGLKMPTLVMHGTEDRLVPPANARELHRLIPDSTLTWIEGGGHVLFSDSPDAFVDAVLAFTASVPT